MPLVDLDDPAELRARWSALAAVAHATGFDRRWYADGDGWYHQDETGSDLRMVRLDGARAVLFGFHTQHSGTAGSDLLAGSPEWIGQPEVKRRMAAGQLGFVYGSFNGTWARAAYPGDPWQPLDDGFAPIAQWVTSDEDAARELIEWAAEWADYLGGLDELLPVGVALIRTAGSGGLTAEVLRDLFERLGLGPRSPQDPDLRAALVAAAEFGDGIVAPGAVDAESLGRTGRMSAAYGEAPTYAESVEYAEPEPAFGEPAFSGPDDAPTGFVPAVEGDGPEEELFVVPPGISPFTGQPIDDQMIGEPFVPEPPITPEPPFPVEPPLRPDPPFTPEPPPYQPDPQPDPEPRSGSNGYGVTGKKPRRFGRKKKHEEGDDPLAVLGLFGPTEPEPNQYYDEQPPDQAPAAYHQNSPTYEQDRPGSEQDPSAYQQNPPAYEQEPRAYEQKPPAYQQDLPTYETDRPADQQDPPGYQHDPPAYQQAPYGQYQDDDGPASPEQYLGDRRLPATEPPRVGGPVQDGEDFYASLFADAPAAASYTPDVPTDVATEWSADAPSPFTPLVNPSTSASDDTGVLSPLEDTAPADSPFAPPVDRAEQPGQQGSESADAMTPPAPPQESPAWATEQAHDSVPAPAEGHDEERTGADAPGDDDAPTAEIDAVVDAPSVDGVAEGARPDQLSPRADATAEPATSNADRRAPAAGQTGPLDPDTAEAGAVARFDVPGGDAGAAARFDVPGVDAGAAARFDVGAVDADADTGAISAVGAEADTGAIPTVDRDAAGGGVAAEQVATAGDDTAGLQAVGDDDGDDEYYPSDVSPFAPADEGADDDGYGRELPLLTNGFGSIDPAELQPGEQGYEFGGEVFHDELIGDGDWTADQLGEPQPTTANSEKTSPDQPTPDQPSPDQPSPDQSTTDQSTTPYPAATAEDGDRRIADDQPNVEFADADADERLGSLAGARDEQVGRYDALDGPRDEEGGRYDALDGLRVEQGERYDALDGPRDEEGERYDALDGPRVEQGGRGREQDQRLEVEGELERPRFERAQQAEGQVEVESAAALTEVPDSLGEARETEARPSAAANQLGHPSAEFGGSERASERTQAAPTGSAQADAVPLDPEYSPTATQRAADGPAYAPGEAQGAATGLDDAPPRAQGAAAGPSYEPDATNGVAAGRGYAAGGPGRVGDESASAVAGSEYVGSGLGGSEYEGDSLDAESGGAESGRAESAAGEPVEVERLVAPPSGSGGLAIPGLGLVGGESPKVEPLPGSIEEAMRSEYERPRPLPKESAALEALREWCRARTKLVPSGFTIQVQVLDPDHPSYRFDLEPPEVDDPQYGADRLAELLADLWTAESQSEQGAWLFARLDAAGRTLRIDRWYDQVPDWWDHPIEQRLDVHGLVRRLNGRGPDWQPSYLEKLYTTAR